MMNNTDTTWLNRIRAMLAKAESTDSPEEAAAFTKKAQELMLKHSIDEAMLDAQQGRPTAKMEAKSYQLHHTSAHARRIVIYLIFPVVEGVGTVRLLTTRGDAKTYWLVGRADDIEAMELLINSLVSQAMSSMKVWASMDPNLRYLDRAEQRTAKGQFLISFGLAVGRRVKEMYQGFIQTTGSELVLVNRRREVDAFMAMNIATKSTAGRGLRGSTLGRTEGRAAGERANLGRSVTNSTTRTAIH